MTRVTPFFVQVILGVAVAELTVQYSQITDSGAMLWTPLLFRKRISGRVVTVAGEEGRSKGERVRGGGSGKGIMPNHKAAGSPQPH